MTEAMPLDFIDIGSSKGGSVRFCQRHFGKNGYGVDIDPKKVAIAQKAGYDVRLMDIQDITDKAKWVTCMHVIEHLSGREEARAMIEKMCEIGENVLITFPYFDADGLLYQHNLKMFWSDWTGHPYHCSSLELHNILRDIGCEFEIELWGSNIIHSISKDVLPLSAPKDSLEYNPQTMQRKVEMGLPTIHREIRCVIGGTAFLDKIR